MRGGKREGAGRKLIHLAPMKTKAIRMTDEEYRLVKEYIKQMRSVKNEL
jgi:hypothetical protein